MSTVTAYFLIYNAVRKLQQYFPSYIVVINPWAENRSQNFLQNRNILKENRESRHHDSNAFNVLRVSHSIEINYVRHTSLPRFAKLSPEGWRSRIDRRAPSRIAPCKFNLRNKIARPRCLTKRNGKGRGVLTYRFQPGRPLKHYDCVTQPRLPPTPSSTSLMLPGWGSPRALPAFCSWNFFSNSAWYPRSIVTEAQKKILVIWISSFTSFL